MSKQTWIAQVSSGYGIGAGFLVEPDVVITCAHLIRDKQNATVSFPIHPRKFRRSASVLVCGDLDPVRTDPADDLAVLRLDRAVDIPAAMIGSLAALEVSNSELEVVGFPHGYDQGQATVVGVYPSVQFAGGTSYQIQSLPGRPQLQKGYSGGGVVLPSDLVVGMVTSADAQNGVGWMLPVRRMCELWPPLRALIALGDLSPRAYLDLTDLIAGVAVPDPREEYAKLLAVPREIGMLPPLPANVQTLQQVVEFLMIEVTVAPTVRKFLLGLFLTGCGSIAGGGAATRIREWIDTHLHEQAYAVATGSSPTDPPPPSPAAEAAASVVVQIERSAGGTNMYRVTMRTIRYPEVVGTEPVVQTMTKREIKRHVVRTVPGMVRLARDRDVMIEFVVPASWIGEPLDEWEVPDSPSEPLGWICPVVVRGLEQYTDDSPDKRDRWMHVPGRKVSQALRWLACLERRGPTVFLALLRGDDKLGALAMTSTITKDMLAGAFRVGMPVLLWPRSECPDDHGDGAHDCAGSRFRDELMAGLADSIIDDLPRRIRTLRANAGEVPERPHPGRQVTLYWDSPDRPPLPEAPLRLAE